MRNKNLLIISVIVLGLILVLWQTRKPSQPEEPGGQQVLYGPEQLPPSLSAIPLFQKQEITDNFSVIDSDSQRDEVIFIADSGAAEAFDFYLDFFNTRLAGTYKITSQSKAEDYGFISATGIEGTLSVNISKNSINEKTYVQLINVFQPNELKTKILDLQ